MFSAVSHSSRSRRKGKRRKKKLPRTSSSRGSRTALDVEEVLSGACDEQLRLMVADVIKSCDTVDSVVLGCLPGFEGCIFLP